MFSAANILKNARLDKELELAEISKKIKVPVKYIEAIESENTANFPQEPYCSLIVKDYADYLGLNGPEILSLFRRDFAQKRKQKTTSKFLFTFTPQFTFSLSIIVIIIFFSIFIISEYYKFNSPPKLKISWPASVVLGNSIELNGVTDPEATVRINQDLIIVDSKGNFQKKVILDGNETKIVVESKSPSGKTTTEEKNIIRNQ